MTAGTDVAVAHALLRHPDAPEAHCVLAPDPRRPGGFVQHYFDSRGVVRR